MLTYRLDRKQIEDCVKFYGFLVQSASLECLLIIDETYYIERYVNNDFLFYVHIKEKGRVIEKICVYKKEK